MSQIAIKGATTGTGVFTLESPATNTDRTLILPDEAGTVLTSASDVAQKGVPIFRATKSASVQSITANTSTKVVYDTVVVDSTSNYDSGNSRYTPNVAGYYLVKCSADIGASTNTLNRAQVMIYKNGSNYSAMGAFISGFVGSEAGVMDVDLIYLNGSTDYIEAYVYANGTSLVVYNSVVWTNFSAVLVRAD